LRRAQGRRHRGLWRADRRSAQGRRLVVLLTGVYNKLNFPKVIRISIYNMLPTKLISSHQAGLCYSLLDKNIRHKYNTTLTNSYVRYWLLQNKP
jgi:hypothetical protein